MFDRIKKFFGKKEEKTRYVKMYVDIPFQEIKCTPFDYSAFTGIKEDSEKEDKEKSDS